MGIGWSNDAPVTIEDEITRFVDHLNTKVAPKLRDHITLDPLFRYASKRAGRRWTRIYTLHLVRDGEMPRVVRSSVFCYVHNETGLVYKGSRWQWPRRHDQHEYSLMDPASRYRLYSLAVTGRAFHHRGQIPDPGNSQMRSTPDVRQ